MPVVAPTSDVFGEGLGVADEVYIDEDGDAVLVYTDDEFEGEDLMIGGDVSAGLLHLFLVDTAATGSVGEGDDTELTATAMIQQDLFAAEGGMVTAVPDDITSAEAFVSGEISHETNELEAGVDLTFIDESPTSMTGEFESAGEVMLSHDAFAVDAHGSFSTDEPASEYPELYDVRIEQNGETFEGEVTQARTVHEFEADRWSSEGNVSTMLENQFEPVAEELGGEATVDITAYAFEETGTGEYYAELTYEVELRGVLEGFADSVAQELAADPGLSISDEQAAAIATAIEDIEVAEFDIGYTIDPTAGMSAAATVHLSGLSPVIEEVLSVAENELDAVEREEFESVRTAYSAHAQADVEHHLSWDVSAVSERDADRSTVRLIADVEAYSTNWDAYADEMGSDGLAGADVTFDFELDVRDDELVTTGEIRVAQEDLLESGIDSLVGMVREDGVDAETRNLIDAIIASELEVARIDYDVRDGEVIVEGGAKHNDFAAAFPDDTPVPESFITVGSDGATTYVAVSGLIDDPDGVAKETVRESAVVGAETAVYLPAEWDEEFPEFDLEAAAEYMDVELTEQGDGDDSTDIGEESSNDGAPADDPTDGDDGLPGFGIAAAAIGLGIGCGYRIMRR